MMIDTPHLSDRRAYVKPAGGKNLPPPIPTSIMYQVCRRLYCDARRYPDGAVFANAAHNPWCWLLGHRWSR